MALCILPAMTIRKLSQAEHDAYRAPWTDPASRKILCKFPQNLCIGGEPAAINDMQQAYMKWLQGSGMPKLLCYTDPGLLINETVAQWCEANLPNCQVANVGQGLHYIQEDCPREIGQATSTWLSGI